MDDHVILALARFAAALTNLALGMVVFMARPDRIQNRLVGIMLLLNFFIHSFLGATAIVPESRLAYAFFAPAFLSMIVYVATYLIFTGTLDTPLSRPFRGRWGPRVVVGIASVFAFTLFFARDLWYAPALPWPADPIGAGWDSVLHTYTMKSLLEFIIFLHFLFGFVVAFHAFLRADDPVERRKMKWFAIAFGVHDLLVGVTFGMSVFLESTGASCLSCDLFAFFVLISVAGVFLAAGLAYGILANQLFDIDLKIKRGISRSTLIAVFIAVFAGVSAVAEEFLSDSFGLMAGGLAATFLVLALSPLQRFADRVSDAAMPGVRETPEYIAERKREIYRVTLQSAKHDGVITKRERRVLATLADELGLTATEAIDLEEA